MIYTVNVRIQTDNDMRALGRRIADTLRGGECIELIGVMSYELAESLQDNTVITIVEWASTIDAVLPDTAIRITITMTPDDESRNVEITGIAL